MKYLAFLATILLATHGLISGLAGNEKTMAGFETPGGRILFVAAIIVAIVVTIATSIQAESSRETWHGGNSVDVLYGGVLIGAVTWTVAVLLGLAVHWAITGVV